jgi:hypothetical protein
MASTKEPRLQSHLRASTRNSINSLWARVGDLWAILFGFVPQLLPESELTVAHLGFENVKLPLEESCPVSSRAMAWRWHVQRRCVSGDTVMFVLLTI